MSSQNSLLQSPRRPARQIQVPNAPRRNRHPVNSHPDNSVPEHICRKLIDDELFDVPIVFIQTGFPSAA